MAQPRHSGSAPDAIVVGAGIIGLAVAWSAARRGMRITVVDRLAPAGGATRVAAGMLAPVGELQHGEEALLEMTAAGARIYPEWVARLEEESGIEVGYEAHGALHVALDRDEAAELRRRHELQVRLGLDARWLGPSGCRDVEPGLHPSLHGGVHVRGEASVDPRRLTGALLTALERRGVEVSSGSEVRELVVEGDRVAGVRLADGAERRAGAVICAAGPWVAGEWLPEEVRPPVRPVKGEILELQARQGERVCEGIVGSERVYVVPRPDGRVIVGATSEDSGFDDAVTAGGVLELLREAYRLLPDTAELRLVEAAAGLRPVTRDNVPVVGRSAVEGLLMATGHGRNGILLAPGTGEAVADVLEGGTVEGPLAAADPARFAGAASGVRA